MAERDAIVGGKNVYVGPLKDQSGVLKVKAGESPSDGDLWGMDYLLEGIVGSLN